MKNKTQSTSVSLDLDAIRIDGGTQSRVELNHETVEEYSEAMSEGAVFPPVVVFFDGAAHWLADGFHRYFGASHAGIEQIDADVRTGTQLDAQLFSFGVNADHGLRRSNADKRKAVQGALKHPVSCKWSDRQIAKHCGVHHDTVGTARASLADSASDTQKGAERTYTTKHGTTAVMNTAKIGKTAAKPVAPAVATPDVTATAPAPAAPPAMAPADEAPEYDGPSNEEIRAAQMQEEADQVAFNKLLLADDKLATAHEEIKRLNAVNSVLESRMQGLMNEKAEAIKLVKARDRQIAKLEAKLKEVA